MKIGIVSDDLTGSLDTGVQLRRFGLKSVLYLKEWNVGHADVKIINTDTRNIGVDQIFDQMECAIKALDGRYVYKKIDSTLRGHLIKEITATLALTSFQKAVICPAIIEEGRQVINGELLIYGQPLHETAFASDLNWPATTSSIQQKLGKNSDHIPLSVIRLGSDHLQQYLQGLGSKFIIPDAENEKDLRIIAESIVSTDILPCGALGLARAWASALTGRNQKSDIIPPRVTAPLLFVIGSHHPITRQQADLLVDSGQTSIHIVHSNEPNSLEALYNYLIDGYRDGKSILLESPDQYIGDHDKQAEMMDGLARLTSTIIEEQAPDALFMCGGETSTAILRILGTESIEILGESLHGIPFGILEGGLGDGVLVLTKPGGFGDNQSLRSLYDQLICLNK